MQSPARMESEGRFRMSDGFELFYRKWEAGVEAERVILGLNGIGSHSGAFRLMGENLPKMVPGTILYATDRRGFGNSVEPGFKRGAVSSFKKYLVDVDETVQLIRKENPGKKFYLFGKSEGTIHALRVAATRPESVDGLILAACPVIPKANFGGAGLAARVVLLRVFSPNSMIDTLRYQPKTLQQSDEIESAMEDPLSSKMMFSARFAIGVPSLVRSILKNAAQVRVPSLILQGDADNTLAPESGSRLLEALESTDKFLKIFKGSDHSFYDSLPPRANSMYNDSMRKQVYDVISDWLRTQ